MSNYFGNLAANLTDKENTESNLITPLNNLQMKTTTNPFTKTTQTTMKFTKSSLTIVPVVTTVSLYDI